MKWRFMIVCKHRWPFYQWKSHYFASQDINKNIYHWLFQMFSNNNEDQIVTYKPLHSVSAKLLYHQDEFRSHYFCCLKNKEITDFPHDKIMKNPGKSLLRRVKVYSTCHLPDTGDSMVQCSKCLVSPNMLRKRQAIAKTV